MAVGQGLWVCMMGHCREARRGQRPAGRRLAKLLCGAAASASVLSGQVSCGGLTLTLGPAPQPLT